MNLFIPWSRLEILLRAEFFFCAWSISRSQALLQCMVMKTNKVLGRILSYIKKKCRWDPNLSFSDVGQGSIISTQLITLRLVHHSPLGTSISASCLSFCWVHHSTLYSSISTSYFSLFWLPHSQLGTPLSVRYITFRYRYITLHCIATSLFAWYIILC